MQHRSIRIDDQPPEVLRFFEEIGDQPIIVERAGKPVCILYPSHELRVMAEGKLADAAGGWADIPSDVLREIAGFDR